MSRPPAGTDAGVFVFRPRTGLVACVLWAILGLVWLGLAARSSGSELLQAAPFVALISIVVYAVCGRPLVRVTDRDVLLRNVLRDVTIPYSAITAIDTQYTLTITTVGGTRHQAWAAPAGGRLGAARVTEEERKSLSWSGSVQDIPASAGLRSDAGAAAVAIRRKLEASRSPRTRTDGWKPPNPTDPEVVRVTWARGVLIALTITVIVAVAILLATS